MAKLGAQALRRIDLRNLLFIALAFALVLVLISPARSYPIIDDWIYFQSVRDLLNLSYHPHDWSQAIGIGHIAWGALFAALFGNSFTVLSVANLVISLANLLTFYLLLRVLGVSASPALVGVALLGFNPIYLSLSYSFMTDITFLFYVMSASLLYMLGLKSGSQVWLWLGGLAVALAYLTRQFGILVVPAVLVWLWMSRRWNWRQALALSALPAIAVAGYAIWERSQPVPLVTHLTESIRSQIFQDPPHYLLERGPWASWLLCWLGIMLLPVLRLPKRPIVAAPILLFLAFFCLRSFVLYGSVFPQSGNVLDATGLLMHNYIGHHVWNEGVWLVIGLVGALAISIHLSYCLEQLWQWLKNKPWQRRVPVDDYALILYILSWSIAGLLLVATPFLFDRYGLVLLPALMLPQLRRRSEPASQPSDYTRFAAWKPRLALVSLALFSLLALRDYKEHATVRWNAAQSLVAAGASPLNVRAGFEWENFYGFEPAAQRIRQTGDLKNIVYPPGEVFDPIYAISDIPLEGYNETGATLYRSWLDGGAYRQVLTMKRK